MRATCWLPALTPQFHGRIFCCDTTQIFCCDTYLRILFASPSPTGHGDADLRHITCCDTCVAATIILRALINNAILCCDLLLTSIKCHRAGRGELKFQRAAPASAREANIQYTISVSCRSKISGRGTANATHIRIRISYIQYTIYPCRVAAKYPAVFFFIVAPPVPLNL